MKQMNNPISNRYVTRAQIAALPCGVLYDGQDLALHREVILYAVHHIPGGMHDEFVRKFSRASSFDHDGFLHILDTSFEERSMLVVLQRKSGKPLIQELRQRMWTFPRVISLVTDLGVSMLDAMEEQIGGFSVAADNLWLSDDGRLSVINYWQIGERNTQGAVGLCGLLVQLFAGSTEIPWTSEELDEILGRLHYLQATAEQKDMFIKLVRRVSLGQASLSAFIFGLRELQQANQQRVEPVSTAAPSPVAPDASLPTSRSRQQEVPRRKMDSVPAVPADEELEEEEDAKTPFYKKAVVGVSALIVAAFLIWVLWPSPKPEQNVPSAGTGSSKPTQDSAVQTTQPSVQPSAASASPGNGITQDQAVSVPNLVGMTQADAEKQVLSAGLHYKFFLEANPLAKGTVFKQDPEPGATTANGGTVTFWVSKGNQ
jgi:hypothetical protein